MKLFHYVENYLSLTETFIYNYTLASASDSDNEILIATFAVQNENLFPLPINVRFFKIETAPSRKTLKGLWYLFRETMIGFPYPYKALKNLLLKQRPDIVHCHFGPNGIIFGQILESIRVKQKFVVSFYGFDVGHLSNTRKGYTGDLKKLWTQCSGVFCEGPFLLSKLIELGLPREKAFVNPIIIDPSRYPVRPELDSNPTEKVTQFLIIGRFAEKKGIHLSLKALGEIKRGGFQEFKVTIVGEGPLRVLYDEIIAEYELAERIDFKGLIPLEKCKELMMSHDVLLHPSLESITKDSEGGAPTVLIEAQFIGIPVIASKHADIPFVMGYPDFLCDENNLEDLITTILKYLQTSPEKLNQLTKQGRLHVLRQHSFENQIYIHHLKAIARA